MSDDNTATGNSHVNRAWGSFTAAERAEMAADGWSEDRVRERLTELVRLDTAELLTRWCACFDIEPSFIAVFEAIGSRPDMTEEDRLAGAKFLLAAGQTPDVPLAGIVDASRAWCRQLPIDGDTQR